MIARTGVQRGATARRRNAKKAKDQAARTEWRKAEKLAETGENLNFDPAEAFENTLTSTQEHTLTDQEILDLGAQVRDMLNLGGS